MSSTKLQYIIKFGISPYVKEKLIYDVKNTPYTFKFDETTNRQVYKQYDGYLQYWSNESDEIVNSYCGSLFIGHCTSENLLDHYIIYFLLYLVRDGSTVNLSFEEKLIDNLKGETGNHILKLGSCSLHAVHTAVWKEVLVLPLDFDSFFHDLHFFFKYSSARGDDYQRMEELPNITAEFAKKHVDTRWLSMKLTCVRVLEQWNNLCEYFLTFLPTQKNFKREILPTMRYKRIKAALKNRTTQAYISFCSYVAQYFENFLRKFQANEPMIHMFYPEICKLLTNLMSKFIRKKNYHKILRKMLILMS